MSKKKKVLIENSLFKPDIEQRIFLIRGERVMIDRDLAELYGVPTKALNRQVKRNKDRFPTRFMFQLTRKERDELVPKWHQLSAMKHSYILPYAFTEHGVAMLASVLRSERAVKISIHIIDTFVRLRQWIFANSELARKLTELEQKVKKHDVKIQAIIEAIRRLMTQPEKPKRKIGFHS